MFSICRQQGKIRRSINICPISKHLQRASSPPLALRCELLWFIQFFSRVSAARLIGIPSNLFPNLNIPMKHRQIGRQRVRFALHKRFRITVGCLLLRRKICWFQVDFSSPEIFWKEVEVLMSVKSCSAPPIVGVWMLSFTCWHSRSEFKCHCPSIFQ